MYALMDEAGLTTFSFFFPLLFGSRKDLPCPSRPTCQASSNFVFCTEKDHTKICMVFLPRPTVCFFWAQNKLEVGGQGGQGGHGTFSWIKSMEK